jgi:hypothetical protein
VTYRTGYNILNATNIPFSACCVTEHLVQKYQISEPPIGHNNKYSQPSVLKPNSNAFPTIGRGLGPGILSDNIIIGRILARRCKYRTTAPSTIQLSATVSILTRNNTNCASQNYYQNCGRVRSGGDRCALRREALKK